MLASKHLMLLRFISSFFAINLAASAFGLLPEDEVQALRDIANTMGKKDWDFNVDPCSGESGWATTNGRKGFQNYVTCNCSFADAPLCHIVSIVLTEQSLQGELPPQLVKLPYLQVFHVNDNYLNGTLPPQWGSMRLLHLALAANRISGTIPKEFGSMSDLVNFTLESNQLSGSIPPELGNLPHLERLILTSSNLGGELPSSLGRLTALRDFWIGDNQFTGQIPEYIQNWTNLTTLYIQGSGLGGPIPSGIAALVNLRDLRISDLHGPEQPFPPLYNMTNLVNLVLRSCNISDELPPYIGNIKTLNTLDLSFNKLRGEIPSNYSRLVNTKYIYLTGNVLTGLVPDWMFKTGGQIDLSYNNFTVQSPSRGCQYGNVNLFGSSLYNNNLSTIVPCLSTYHCSQNLPSLHLNCAGEKATGDGHVQFDDDTNPGGPSNFFQSGPNWAVSNTGHFMDNSVTGQVYINTTNISSGNAYLRLYASARLSPLSLTYYGMCLENGNYALKLHFEEIIFTNDETYNSLGRRVFDIYVQGKLVYKDFNIAAEAGGNGIPIMRTFPTVVTGNTLEIRFYWAGKGSNGLPYRGVYGPLVSAISIDPEPGSSLSIIAIFGIAAGAACLATLLVVGVRWWRGRMSREPKGQEKQKGQTRLYSLAEQKLPSGRYTFAEIKAATNNFKPLNKIGEGGFGPVYMGTLSNGTKIAVKQLSSLSQQGNREFLNEIAMISALQHTHLVELYGCCIEKNQLLLVYEYLENNSLARALFGPEEHRLRLEWATRHMICLGIAKGLAFLHGESRLKVVHRDIKASNVLLDQDLRPKISDFGLAKLNEEEKTHMSTKIAGTYGYIAPEYQMRGHLTDKADVYSFGIVALEIVTGKSIAVHQRMDGETCNILGWALDMKRNGRLMELVDSRLGSEFSRKEALDMINVALLCTDMTPGARPSMSCVVMMLQGIEAVPEPEPGVAAVEARKRIMELITENGMEADL